MQLKQLVFLKNHKLVYLNLKLLEINFLIVGRKLGVKISGHNIFYIYKIMSLKYLQN